MSNKFYLTTAIYYANAAPHIGHAYEIIAADVIARFQRMLGKEVYFLTGTDEHGIKVEKTAEAAGLTPQAFVDDVAHKFEGVWKSLNITHDRFIRTTEKAHYDAVAKIWTILKSKDDIYKATYTADYCRGCEAFLNERDKDPEGHCLIHKTKPEPVEEENYFFRLSRYKDALLKLLVSNSEENQFIIPQQRATEIINIIEDLQDISVSRARTSVSWGIPVPDDSEQVIYVWIDALSNYLTGIDWNPDSENAQFRKFWPPNVQIIGKDIARFHAIYWTAMLMAAELPLPETLLIHGFINIGETKLSKSSGNIISIQDLMERLNLPNVDPIRYYLMATTGFASDGNYTDDDFKLKVNADLANNLGNLLNRTLSMLNKYCNGVIPASAQLEKLLSPDDFAEIHVLYSTYKFNEALAKIIAFMDQVNKYINDEAPWKLASEGNTERLHVVLYSALNALRQAALLLFPVTPTLSQEIFTQLGCASIEGIQWLDILNTSIPAGQQTQLGDPILLRLDSDLAGSDKKK